MAIHVHIQALLHPYRSVGAPADVHCGVQDPLARIGRLTFPISMLAFPFYLMSRSPGKQGSHYDPKADLFLESEEPLVSPSCLCLLVQDTHGITLDNHQALAGHGPCMADSTVSIEADIVLWHAYVTLW